MEAAHLIAFNLALLAGMASPGPALLVAIRATLAGGRAAGIATGMGVGLGAASWTLAALLGLDALFALAPWAYSTAKLAGAAYLIWIAITTWRFANVPLAAAPPMGRRAILSGTLVSLGNPKSLLFTAAVLVVIFPQDLSIGEMALVTIDHLIVELAVYTLIAALLSRDAVRRRYLAPKPALDGVSALVRGALGLRLLTENR